MSKQICWVLELAIQPGQIENFRAVARDLITSARSEPGTLSYEWSLNKDQTTCQAFERYRDSAAVLAHVHRFGPFAERFLQACRPVRFDVYGSPNEEARAVLADFRPTYYSHLGGFTR